MIKCSRRILFKLITLNYKLSSFYQKMSSSVAVPKRVNKSKKNQRSSKTKTIQRQSKNELNVVVGI